MNPLTHEWAQKAEQDLLAAQKLFRNRTSPLYDAVCFHSQQCAEKYLKAFLQENQKPVPKTHKLTELLELCRPLDNSLEFLRTDLIRLERFAVQVRYPGMETEKDDAKSALKSAQAVRMFVRQRLGL